MTTRTELEQDDDIVRSYYDIPHEDQLHQMSFVQLLSLLASCQKDSPKFITIERELKKHIAKDQAEINRPNMLWAAGVGGIFALAGVVIGWYLNTPTPQQVAPASTMQQTEKSKLAIDPPSGKVVHAITKPIVDSTNKPAPEQTNAQPSK